ncbi:hypothetical protein J6590_105010, partial [Homalodisca vitripennis]
ESYHRRKRLLPCLAICLLEAVKDFSSICYMTFLNSYRMLLMWYHMLSVRG